MTQRWKPSKKQEQGLTKMMKQAAVGLFADPGVGKTSMVLAAFKVLKNMGVANKMLVVAPLFPLYNAWEGELEKWEDFHEFTYTFLHGDDKEKNLERDVDIYFINYEGLLWLFPDLSPKGKAKDRHSRHLRWDWDILCLDESTALKDSQTKRFGRVRSHLGDFRRRWILTGTPSPNGYADLFGQIFVLDGGAALGEYITHFRNRYMIRGYTGHTYDMRPGAEEEIEEAIAPYVVRLEADKDWEEVPLYTDVRLPAECMAEYKELERDFYLQLEEAEIVASNAGVVGGKLRQYANGALYATDDCDERFWVRVHDYKLDALASILSELNGSPLLVFYEFQSDRDRILERWPGTPVVGGGISPERANQIVKEFNQGKHPMIIAHPQSASKGLNIQEFGNRVCWFGITWNLEHYIQANARVGRQGQQKPQVFIHHIRCVGTKDTDVIERLREKDMTQSKLLSAVARK